MTSEKRLSELTDLEHVLDTFGGDPARWPEARRGPLLSLVASDTGARKLLREAEALDALLGRAAGPPVGETTTFANRIVAAAIAGESGRPVAERLDVGASGTAGKPGIVIAWPRSKNSHAVRPSTTAGTPPRRDRASLRAAALLAASLMVGVFLGAMDLVPAGVTRLVPGVQTGVDAPREFALLQGDDLLDFLDEEPL